MMQREEAIAIINEYYAECREIAAECEAEGYPAHGENYDLRCEALWESYLQMYPELADDGEEDEA